MHVSGGDWPDQLPILSSTDCECDENRSAIVISADRDEAIFVGGMDRVGSDTRLPPQNCFDFGDWNAVATHLEIVVARLPESALAHQVLSEAYSHLGRHENAAREKSKAMQLRSQNP